MVRVRLHRVQRTDLRRQGKLLPELGRSADAGEEGAGPARHALFRQELTPAPKMLRLGLRSQSQVKIKKGGNMLRRHSIWAAVQGLALLSTVVAAQAHDPSKYPDLRGQWDRMAYPGTGAPSFDQSKGQGLRQQAPLT